MRHTATVAQFSTTTKAFDGAMYLIVIVFGGYLTVRGSLTAGDLVAYIMYVTTLIATIRRIIEFAEQFQRGMTGIERFLGIIDADIEIFDEPGAVELCNPRGDITFEDVTFEYSDDNNQVFHNLNLKISAGEKVAIVGPSGGGKTTLCNLIPRFYDVSHGHCNGGRQRRTRIYLEEPARQYRHCSAGCITFSPARCLKI